EFESSSRPSAFSTSWLLESARKSLCSSALSARYRGSLGSISPTAEISIVPGAVTATGAAATGVGVGVAGVGCEAVGADCAWVVAAGAADGRCATYHATAPIANTATPIATATAAFCDFFSGGTAAATGAGAARPVIAAAVAAASTVASAAPTSVGSADAADTPGAAARNASANS